MPSSPASSRPATELCCPYGRLASVLTGTACAASRPSCHTIDSLHSSDLGTVAAARHRRTSLRHRSTLQVASIKPTHHQTARITQNHRKIATYPSIQIGRLSSRVLPYGSAERISNRQRYCAAPPLPTAFPFPALCVQLAKVFGNIRFTLFPRLCTHCQHIRSISMPCIPFILRH